MLASGCDPKAQACRWLKDQYGVSWQVVPARLAEMLKDHESRKTQRACAAMLKMKKMDLAETERA